VKYRLNKILVCVLIATFLASAVGIAFPVRAAAGATIALINPLDGSSNFNFTPAQKILGDTFDINVTITNATLVSGWQVGITWDPTLLEGVKMVLPSDNVFAYDSPIPAFDLTISGLVVGGANLGVGQASFNGSGRLAVLTLKIINVVGQVSCNIDFEPKPLTPNGDTFLLRGLLTILPDVVGASYSYTGPSGPKHDVAVTKVVTNGTSVVNGSSLNVNVTVTNTGGFTETFNVAVFVNSVQAAPNQTATALPSGNSTTLTFIWNTNGFALGGYALNATADLPGDPTPADNNFPFGTVQIIQEGAGHDVAILKIVPVNPASVGQGFSLNVSVTVTNDGSGGFSETFGVAIYANGTQAAPLQTETGLSPNNNATLTFEWNTTGWVIGNYTLSAFADLPTDPTPADNNVTYGNIYVMLPGDVLNAGVVSIKSIGLYITLFEATFNAFARTSRYNPFMDINADGRIDIRDMVIVIMNFNKRL